MFSWLIPLSSLSSRISFPSPPARFPVQVLFPVLVYNYPLTSSTIPSAAFSPPPSSPHNHIPDKAIAKDRPTSSRSTHHNQPMPSPSSRGAIQKHAQICTWHVGTGVKLLKRRASGMIGLSLSESFSSLPHGDGHSSTNSMIQ